MAKKTAKSTQPRCHVLTVKISAEERTELIRFAEARCVNISALVRKLLFEQLRKATP